MRSQPQRDRPALQRQSGDAEEKDPIRPGELIGYGLKATPRFVSGRASLPDWGQPLAPSDRTFFEQRFGQDFRHVRIHTGPKAAALVRAVQARAFTMGRDIVFGDGELSTGTASGRHLLAHELTHVVQQHQRGDLPHLQRQQPVPAPSDETPPREAPVYLPTATIILVGSPTKPTGSLDKWPYNFSDAAVLAVPKIRQAIPGTQVTILFFSIGYKLRGVENENNVYQKALKDLSSTGAAVVEVASDSDVINFLNTGLVSPDEDTPIRAAKISRFLYFGHGGTSLLLLNFGWGEQSHSINKKEIERIKTEAFKPRGVSYLFTCSVAKGEQSFMSVWASYLGQSAVGPEGKTAYQIDARYEIHSLEKSINEKLPGWFLGMPYMNQVKIIEAPPPLPPPSLTGESPLP